MRARIALSLSLTLVMLVSTLVMNVSFASPTTTLSVNPSLIVGNPGDTFQVDIDVSDVVDLYTYAFELHFAPFGYILAVVKVTEGDFIDVDKFVYNILVLEGIVQVGGSLQGPKPGVDGSGTLATIKFKVLEAGESDLTLVNTELHDSSPESLIPHEVTHGYYYGPYAEGGGSAVLTGTSGDSMVAHTGDTITIAGTTITHMGTTGHANLTVQMRYDLIRRDGRILSLWSPQPTITELRVDGYDASWGGMGWTEYGSGPLLDAVGDGNYIEAADYCSIIGMFSLEDITLAPGQVITGVALEAYSKGDPIIDGDVYLFTYEAGWVWTGSIEATSDWGWYFSEYGDALEPWLYDEASINSAELLIHYWTPDGASHGPMTIDAIKLIISTATTITIDPGETVVMPSMEYTFALEDKGVYRVLKATAYFTHVGTYIAGKVENPIIVVTPEAQYDWIKVRGKPAHP